MLDRVLATISRHHMLPHGARVVAAVSGGPDSVCLLHTLRDLKICVTGVAHFNHKLRGEASDEDQRFVAAMARQLGIEFHCATGNLGPGNLEQAARRARRAFFRDLLQRGAGDRVALGHTRDDQAETVLFRILRGSGLAGLAGILPVTAEGLIRPLLNVTRAEVEEFLRKRGIPWREDSTNLEHRFARNRIRHQLLPGLAREWNPHLREALAHLADLAYEEERWWAAEIARRGSELLIATPGAVELHASQLAALPRAVARRLVRQAIRQVKSSRPDVAHALVRAVSRLVSTPVSEADHRSRPGVARSGDAARTSACATLSCDLAGLEFGHVERVIELAERSGGSGKLDLPGVEVIRSFDWMRLEVPGRLVPAGAVRVTVPGRYPSPDGKTLICLEITQNKPSGKRANRGYATLELRGWRPGDHYRPAGHSRDQKLKDLFQRERVPSWRRRSWPILSMSDQSMSDQIVWARQFGWAADGSGPEVSRFLRILEIPAGR